MKMVPRVVLTLVTTEALDIFVRPKSVNLDQALGHDHDVRTLYVAVDDALLIGIWDVK